MMSETKRCWCGAVLFLLWSTASLAQQAGEAPLLTLDRTHPLLGNSGGVPMVQVFPSGLVKIVRPAGLVDPGERTVQLSDGELGAFIRQIGSAQRLPANLLAMQFDDPTGGDPNAELVVKSDATVSTVSFSPLLFNDDSGSGDATIVSERVQRVEMQLLDDIPDNALPGLGSLRVLETNLLDLFSRAGDEQ